MRFTLFYDGDLPPGGSDAAKKAKNEIRVALHPQIKELWTAPGLDSMVELVDPSADGGGQHLTMKRGISFASVVHSHLHLRARLSILMQRSGDPGRLIDSGDIDNRLKTLFDALSVPGDQQIPEGWMPSPDQKPLHCLLEDDKLITSVAVETERLLGQPATSRATRLTIRVHLHAAIASYASQMIITP